MGTPTRAWRGWAVAACALLVAVVVLWATGGLRAANAAIGRQVAPGDELSGRRWNLAVEGARIERPEGRPPRVVVAVRGKADHDRPLHSPDDGIVVIRLSDDGIDHIATGWRPGLGFGQPGVAGEAEGTFEVNDLPPGEQTVIVTVRDERKVNSFISGERWTYGDVLGHVVLVAKEKRP